MRALHDVLGDEGDVAWGVDGGTSVAVDGGEDGGADGGSSLDPVATEVSVELDVVEPDELARSVGNDGGWVKERDGGDLGELGLDADEGAPVERLDERAAAEALLLQDRHDVVDVALNWQSLGRGLWVQLGLQVDRYLAVAVAVDEVEHLLQRRDASEGVQLSLWVGRELLGAVEGLDLREGQVGDELVDVVSGALGGRDLMLEAGFVREDDDRLGCSGALTSCQMTGTPSEVNMVSISRVSTPISRE